LPTGVEDLVIPTAAVAEVIGYQNPALYDSAPSWLLGAVTWRGLAIPLISLSMANAQPIEVEYGHRARSVICYTPSGNKALPYVGISTVGPPRLMRLSPQSLEPSPIPPDNPFVLHGVTLAEQPAWIPNMDAIERAVLESLPS
jgi:chemosensory pili system protein ChpC